MNVGELLKERDRLQGVIQEAKTARYKLKAVNGLIAMYGDDPKVSVDAPVPIHSTQTNGNKPGLYCGKCEAGPYKGAQGLGTHNAKIHGGKVKVY